MRSLANGCALLKRRIRASSVLAAAVALAGSAAVNADEPIFGSNAVGTPSSGLTANFKRASRFTLGEQGTVDRLWYAYLDGNGGASGTQKLRLALYADAGGAPGRKIAETADTTIQAGFAPGWVPFELQDSFPFYQFVLDPGAYWIAIQSDDTGGVARDYSSGTVSNWYANADTYSDHASDPFGAGSLGAGTLSVYIPYSPTSGTRTFGRTDVATVPSAGLSANFKRGSKFTLTEKATLASLNAYVDTNGGASGSQGLAADLYKDAGGVPGDKVAESQAIWIPAGTLGGAWVTFQMPSVALDPGDYWITLHSGNTGGVLRDFGDGAADWYGNANEFKPGYLFDGETTATASSPFGSGTSGTSTLSVYARYWPGYTVLPFGRTDVATGPSAGLSANFMRGSQFSVSSTCAVSGFYAYLDGNGGATGSQQLRVALYDIIHPGGTLYQWEELARSDTLTVEAGMSPQWVYFPLRSPVEIYRLETEPQPRYWLVIQSGGMGGVARDYSDTSSQYLNDWNGQAYDFAQAPAAMAYDPTTGNTTLSVYATCAASPQP